MCLSKLFVPHASPVQGKPPTAILFPRRLRVRPQQRHNHLRRCLERNCPVQGKPPTKKINAAIPPTNFSFRHKCMQLHENEYELSNGIPNNTHAFFKVKEPLVLTPTVT